MRLSRKALATLGLLASVGIGGALIYALQPKNHAPAENLYDTNSHNRADSVNGAPANYGDVPKLRSEEHTSELQSLMRISYAVIFLKQKQQMLQQLATHLLR